jgi:acetylornithine deacetylase/succinyl-diaminopimelate desuccinylase-like protein
VNLIFLFEGEEEIGSPNLASFLLHHRDELRCDVIAISDTGMVAPGVPTLGYGLRGITCCEAILRGPKGDLHSGSSAARWPIPPPPRRAWSPACTMPDGRVAIDGFYDRVRPWKIGNATCGRTSRASAMRIS